MNLGETQAEVIIGNGPNVGLKITVPQGELLLWYQPAQAEELSQSLHDAAVTVLAREGIAGEAHRSAHVTLPTIRFGLRAIEPV